jgi:hypothetical protein
VKNLAGLTVLAKSLEIIGFSVSGSALHKDSRIHDETIIAECMKFGGVNGLWAVVIRKANKEQSAGSSG